MYIMEIRKQNKKRLVVCYDDIGYCHNKKCPFYNVGVGSAGYDEGDKPYCVVCNKPLYITNDGTNNIGNCEVDI